MFPTKRSIATHKRFWKHIATFFLEVAFAYSQLITIVTFSTKCQSYFLRSWHSCQSLLTRINHKTSRLHWLYIIVRWSEWHCWCSRLHFDHLHLIELPTTILTTFLILLFHQAESAERTESILVGIILLYLWIQIYFLAWLSHFMFSLEKYFNFVDR